jgi:hypothetical protein
VVPCLLQDGEAMIRLLMKHGAKINPTNAHKFGWWSPLHEAVEKRRPISARWEAAAASGRCGPL